MAWSALFFVSVESAAMRRAVAFAASPLTRTSDAVAVMISTPLVLLVFSFSGR
jgi:hypothetical protein